MTRRRTILVGSALAFVCVCLLFAIPSGEEVHHSSPSSGSEPLSGLLEAPMLSSRLKGGDRHNTSRVHQVLVPKNRANRHMSTLARWAVFSAVDKSDELPTPLSTSPVVGYIGHPHTQGLPPPRCKYVFDRYEPSPWEERWQSNISFYERNVCASLSGEFKELLDIYIKSLPNCTVNRIPEDTQPLPARCPMPDSPQAFDSRVFSKFHYKLDCEGRDPPPRQPRTRVS